MTIIPDPDDATRRAARARLFALAAMPSPRACPEPALRAAEARAFLERALASLIRDPSRPGP